MLSLALQSAFNKCNDWVSNKNKLGSELSKLQNCVKGNWDFTRDGGAVSTINLKGLDGVETIVIPSGALVTNVAVVVRTAVTSGGLLTLDLNLNAANDSLNAQAVAGLTANAKIQGIPTSGTLSTALLLTADRTLTLDFNVAAATAGNFDVFVWYVF